MSDFKRALAFVLKHEGGYVINPADPGGETKYGISKKAYPNIDIKNLTESEAKLIYARDYWLPSGADEMDNALALVHFDTAVNMGIATAKILLAASKGNVSDYLLRRIRFYMKIIEKRPASKQFLLGWIRRVMDCYEEVIQYGMA